MNETQRNIKRYRAALPGLRERIVASAMLLVISLSMMVSASFAWYTISSAPEVSMLATTVAANGNLEIALADGLVKDEKKKPDEVAIGDSSSTEGKNIVSSNITWGNLVNLSDISYGLGDISLRPALLSDYNLARTPLYGATYSKDGRVEHTDEYYRYTSYTLVGDKMDFSGKAEHLKYGVRAISSVQASAASANAELTVLYKYAEDAFKDTVATYNGIITGESKIPGQNGKSYMDALVEMLEIYVNDTANEVMANHETVGAIVGEYVPSDYGPKVPNLLKLVEKYKEVLDNEGETICNLVNMHIYTKAQKDGEDQEEISKKYVADGAALRAAVTADLRNLGVSSALLNVLAKHIKDYDSILESIEGISTNLIPMVNNGEKIYWDQSQMEIEKGAQETKTPEKFLSTYITELVSIDKTKVGSTQNGGTLVGINQLASKGVTYALNLFKSEPIEVEIGGGVLANTEHRIGALLLENSPDPLNKLGTEVIINIDTNAPAIAESMLGVKINGPKEAAVRTDASTEKGFALIEEMSRAAGLQPEPTDITKKDTYGFAIDFWVRTNTEGAILTLEGNTEYVEQDAKCTNINGDDTDVYIASKTVEIEVPEDETGTESAVGEGTDTETGGDSSLDNLFGDTTPTETITMEVYLLDGTDDDGNAVTYVHDASSHVIVGTYSEMTTPESEQNPSGGYSFDKKTIKIITGYDGVDRIWEDMAEAGLLYEDSTTQGSGSCYVFYANPADQGRILEMLQYFTIAFLDENDFHKATAALDVDKAYEVNGKVTVPLKMVAGPEYEEVDEVTGDSEKKRGIVSLDRNVATWLTAVVYLDGEGMGNENVMESGVVEGRLSLQFGTTNELDGMDDLPLQQKYRTITAKVISDAGESVSRSAPITYTFDGVSKEVKVQLSVEGDQPENITGFFTRMIGANHGTKMESKNFEFKVLNGSVGTWEATFELTNPGEYVFLSAIADGVEYEFNVDQTPAVKIDGREIIRLECDPSGGLYYTSDSNKKITVNAGIAAAADLEPKQVRAILTDSEGKQYTAILGNTGNSESVSDWSGSILLTKSDTYVLEYLVVDGDPTELSSEMKKDNTFVVKLGVQADVKCVSIEKVLKDEDADDTNNTREPLEDEELDLSNPMFTFDRNAEEYALAVKVKLTEGDNEVRNQKNVILTYSKTGGSDADRIDATLRWTDEDGGCYTGFLFVDGVGEYKFYNVSISNSGTATAAPGAPVFTALSPEPPAWDNRGDGNITVDYQYVPNGGAKMYAYFTNADAATAYALIRNVNTGEEKWVKSNAGAEDGEAYRFEFIVPENSADKTTPDADGNPRNNYAEACEGSQDGEWVMVGACLQKVYERVYGAEGTEPVDVLHPEKVDANGNPDGGMFFSEDGSLGYQAAGMSGIETEVVQKVFVRLMDSADNDYSGAVFGKDKDGNTVGEFMQSYTVSGVKVKINKWNGQKVDGIKVDGFSVDHVTAGDANKAYGGYTITSGPSADGAWNLTTSDYITYSAPDLTLPYAGEYVATLSYSINGTQITSPAYKLSYKVWTKTPTVTVSGVGNTAEIPTTMTWVYNSKWKTYSVTLGEKKTSAFDSDKNEATVYAEATYSDWGGNGTFTIPIVKFTVSGVDSDSVVSFNIPSSDASGKVVAFSCTGNVTDKEIELGKIGSAVLNDKPTKYSMTYTITPYHGQGEQIIEEITIVRKGVTFTVTLPTRIYIYNPSSIPTGS